MYVGGLAPGAILNPSVSYTAGLVSAAAVALGREGACSRGAGGENSGRAAGLVSAAAADLGWKGRFQLWGGGRNGGRG